MNGSQLNTWRESERLSLRDLAEQLNALGHHITHVTLSRWERAASELIPKWASDEILSRTRVELPLDELQQLLDYARLHNLNFRQLIARAVHQLLTTEPTNTTTEAHFTTSTQPPMPEDNRLNDPPKLYTTD